MLARAAAGCAAEAEARRALRRAAEAALRAREAARILIQIETGRVVLPSVTVVGERGKPVRVVKDGAAHASELAARVMLAPRRLKKAALSLVRAGKCACPSDVGRSARAEFDAAAAAGAAGGGGGAGAGGTDAAAPGAAAAMALALEFARAPQSLSAASRAALSAVPRVAPPAGGAAPSFSSAQAPCGELDEVVREMLATSLFYQERAREAEPRKALRRVVAGLRECGKFAALGKLALLVVAPNVDVAASPSVDAALTGVVAAARGAGVPVVFALSRKKLGAAMGTRQKATVAGFLSLESIRPLAARAVALAEAARERWRAGGAAAAGGGGAPPPPPRAPFPPSKPLSADAEEYVPGGGFGP